MAEERQRFQRAVAESASEMEALKERLARRLPEFDAAIIDAHRMMLEDRGFLGKVEAAITHGLRGRDARSSTSSTSTSSSSRACRRATCASAPPT